MLIGLIDLHLYGMYSLLGGLCVIFAVPVNLIFWPLQISKLEEEEKLPKFSFKK